MKLKLWKWLGTFSRWARLSFLSGLRGGGVSNRAVVTTRRYGGVWSYNYCHMRPTQTLMNTLRHRDSAVYNAESHAGQRTVKESCRLLGADSWLATADRGDRRVRTVTLDRLRLPISGKNSRVICYRRATALAHYTSSCQIWNLKPLFKNKYCVYWRVYWFHL